MKKVLSTIVALGLFAGAANAAFDPFSDPSLALPRSQGYEQALPRAPHSDDNFREALPRGPFDEFNNPSLPLPLTDATFPDIVIATP
jgi:hypothetical protein